MSKSDWAQFEANVIELLQILGFKCAHFRPAQTKHGWRTPMSGDKGFPDLICVRGDLLLAVELKSGRGKVAPEQQQWLEAFARVEGCRAVVLRPEMLQAFTRDLQAILRQHPDLPPESATMGLRMITRKEGSRDGEDAQSVEPGETR